MRRLFFALAAAALIAVPVLTPSSASAQTEWTIDGPHTAVGFKVRHMMVSWVRGTFDKVDGTIQYEPGSAESLKIDVTIDADSVNTGNAKRDEHLRSPDFFDVAQFPTLTFKSTKAKKTDEGFDVVGKLTLHGITKVVTLRVEGMNEVVTDPWGNVKIGGSATLRLDRKDFGLTWNKTLDGGGIVVGDEVRIELDIELNKKK